MGDLCSCIRTRCTGKPEARSRFRHPCWLGGRRRWRRRNVQITGLARATGVAWNVDAVRRPQSPALRRANAMLRRQDALLVQYQRPLVAGVRRWRCEGDGKEYGEGRFHSSSSGGEFSSKHRSHRPVIRVSFQPSVV